VILRSGKIKNRISDLTLWLDGANVITEKNVAPGNRVVLFSWQAMVGARVTKKSPRTRGRRLRRISV